jgi:hypothetical protein
MAAVGSCCLLEAISEHTLYVAYLGTQAGYGGAAMRAAGATVAAGVMEVRRCAGGRRDLGVRRRGGSNGVEVSGYEDLILFFSDNVSA